MFIFFIVCWSVVILLFYWFNFKYHSLYGFIFLTQNQNCSWNTCVRVSQNVLCDFLHRWKNNFSGFIHTMLVFWLKKIKIHSFFCEKNNFIFFSIQVSFVDRPFYPFRICYFYFTSHFYRHKIIQLFTVMLEIFLNVWFLQHLQLFCHKLACNSYCLPEICNHLHPLALVVNFFKILDLPSCTNQSKFFFEFNKKKHFFESHMKLLINWQIPVVMLVLSIGCRFMRNEHCCICNF